MFQCMFCGHSTATRQALRRHLTFKHDADCRLEKGASGKFSDVIAVLSAEELAVRVAVLKKGQRHVRRRVHEKAMAELVVVPPVKRQPTSFVSSIPARYSTPSTKATGSIFRPVDEAGSSWTSEFDLGSAVNESTHGECEELRHFDGTDDIPHPDLSRWDEPYRVDTPTSECSEDGRSRGAVGRAGNPRGPSDPLTFPPVEAPLPPPSQVVDPRPLHSIV